VHIEHSVQASDPLLRSIFENAQIGISVFSIDGREGFSNRACQQMLGCSEEELRHVESWDKMVHPDDRANFAIQELLGYSEGELRGLEQWDDIVHPEERTSGAERYAALIQGMHEQDEYEHRFVRRDGRVLVANGRFTLLRDAAGKPQYVVGLTEDITERATATGIAHLRALLESNDCETAEAFLALKAASAGTFDQPRLDSQGAAIAEFDFDGALLKLDEIAKDYIGIGSAK
jgi:PAS domain S-box-containing protein